MVRKTRDFKELLGLLEGQRSAQVLLLSLSKCQRGVFEKSGAKGLMKVIARKQQVINRLEALDGRLVPYTSRWGATLRALPAPARREVAALVDDIQAAIRETMESERNIEEVVVVTRNALSGKIRTIKGGLAASKAYTKPALATAGRFLDGEG
ncbi:MAG: hypothetical protein J7M19_06260 [Planctomycetes bacterium]|nr:hypothetical protein [Planctomycetota bacterium]